MGVILRHAVPMVAGIAAGGGVIAGLDALGCPGILRDIMGFLSAFTTTFFLIVLMKRQ